MKFLKSNTIQFNVLYLLGVLASLPFVKGDYLAVVVGVQSLLNILLRLKTGFKE